MASDGTVRAIKLVYGRVDEQHAARELKSLRRIQDLTHPYLLEVEAIESVNGQLAIITELADENMEDVFAQHRQNGAIGIPRDDLLSYLTEAADALDYLFEAQSLQHLDVKPGNILLEKGIERVRLTDFGLARAVELEEDKEED